jgi:hypothetical protein
MAYAGAMNKACRELDGIELCKAVDVANKAKEAAMIIEIEIKSVYGVLKIYPANEAAELIAKIAGTKTLTNEALAYAERLGFEIKEVAPSKLNQVRNGA